MGAALFMAHSTSSWAFLSDTGSVPWPTTASGNRSANGSPVVLTWSIVPDGTAILGDFGLSLGGSDLRSFLNLQFDGDELETDLTERPWFRFFDESFDRWSQISGATYIYEPNDSGGTHNVGQGILGVRGDVRIGGASVDGPGDVLAFNYIPDDGGDMVLDTSEAVFFSNSSGDFVRFRNTIMHEHGHGMSIQHVESNTDGLLMESFIQTSFDGPQLDDIRAAQFFFGDALEKTNNGLGNNTTALATDLGTLDTNTSLMIGTDANTSSQFVAADATDFVSLSGTADTDVYSFRVDEPTRLSAELIPLGGVFNQAGQGQTPTPFDANARVDLALTLFDSNGSSVLASADQQGLGGTERLSEITLPAAGEYFVSVTGSDDTIQLYQLALSAAAPLLGDFNGTGDVEIGDLNLVLFNWNVDGGNLTNIWVNQRPSPGDAVGVDQFNTVLFNWDQTAQLAAVPEPVSLGLMLWLGWPLLRRGNRWARRSGTNLELNVETARKQ